MFSFTFRDVFAVLLVAAVVVMVGLPVAGGEEEREKPLSPQAILEKKFEGEATVELLVAEVATLNIDSLYKPGVSHAQILSAKLPGAKEGQKFEVIVAREVATRLLELGIEDPAKHLRGKLLRVSGPVKLHSEQRYQLWVTSLDQLDTIRKP